MYIYAKISTGQFWQDKELLTQLAIPPAAFALCKGCCPAAGVWLEIPVLGFHLTGGASEEFVFSSPGTTSMRTIITLGNRMYRIQPVHNLALCQMLSPCSMLSWNREQRVEELGRLRMFEVSWGCTWRPWISSIRILSMDWFKGNFTGKPHTYVFQCMQNFGLRLQNCLFRLRAAILAWERFFTFYDFSDSDAWPSQWWNQKPGSRYLLGTGHENAIQFSVRFENGHPSLMLHPTTPKGPTTPHNSCHTLPCTTVWNLQRLWVNFQTSNISRKLIDELDEERNFWAPVKRMPSADHGPWAWLPASQCCQHVWVLAGKAGGSRWTCFHIDSFKLF